VTATARALGALAAALLAPPTLLALHFRDGPPARVTGGFGEDSCEACHFGNVLNDAAGKLMLSGLPERFEPGATYELELALARPGMTTGGFQLAIRNAGDQSQAGRLEVAATDESGLGILEERDVQFAQHRLAATPASGEDSVRWRFTWTAPDGAERVTAHAAAVAADGDDSQAGDHVYTLERTFEAGSQAADASDGGARRAISACATAIDCARASGP
jgi:hypothetical protein